MITHVVVFWLDKQDVSGLDVLKKGCQDYLAKIPEAMEFRFGMPVPSSRGVVDDSFAVGISMTFKDQADADAYQKHELHTKFVAECVKPYVKRFVVYDWA